MAATSNDTDGRPALRQGTLLEGGRYRIEHELGRGGFGITYLATDTTLRQPRAIKEFFPTTAYRIGGAHLTLGRSDYDVERFMREARSAAALQHAGVVRIISVFSEHGTAYIVMEHLEGASLQTYLDHYGPVGVDVARRCLDSLLDTLGYVHGHGIVHRDIKPSNIVVSPDGRYTLIDFGSARAAASTSVDFSRLVSAGYSPLEQYGGQPPTPATDLYSLGATVYALVTGAPPPVASDRANGTPLVPLRRTSSDVDAAMSDAVDKMLAVRPIDRPASAEAVAQLLRTGKLLPPKKSRRRRNPIALAMIPVLLAAATAGFLVSRARNDSPDEASRVRVTEAPPPEVTELAATSTTPPKPTAPSPASAAPAPEMALVPNVEGSPEESVQTALEQVGLTASVRREASNIAAGHVVRQLPQAGKSVPIGAVVEVVVSSGPAATSPPPTVPPPAPVEVPVPVPVPVPIPVPAPAPEPEPSSNRSAASSADLGISGYENSPPACDNRYIVLLKSSVDPSLYRVDIEGALRTYPDARYFHVPGTCSSLRGRYDTGADIYAVYYGPYSSKSRACERSRSIPGTYIAQLNNTSNPKNRPTC